MRAYLEKQRYTLFGLFAIALWSFTAVLAVELSQIPPFQLLFFQFLIAFFVVLARFGTTKKKGDFFNFKPRDLLVASAALIINQLCYYSAFRYSRAAEVDLINYIWPTLLILLSSLLPKEKFCPSSLIASLVCLGGIYYLLSPDYMEERYSINDLTGYFLALGAALSWTLYSLYTRYNSGYTANCISWATGIAAGCCLIIHLYQEQFVLPNIYEALLISLVGILELGLAYYYWEKGIKKGSIKVLGLASYTVPVFSVVILVLFGKADFTKKMIVATIAIATAPLIPLLKHKMSNSLSTSSEQEAE